MILEDVPPAILAEALTEKAVGHQEAKGFDELLAIGVVQAGAGTPAVVHGGGIPRSGQNGGTNGKAFED